MKKILYLVAFTIGSLHALAFGPQSSSEYAEFFLRSGIPYQDPPASEIYPTNWAFDDASGCAYRPEGCPVRNYSRVFRSHVPRYENLNQ